MKKAFGHGLDQAVRLRAADPALAGGTGGAPLDERSLERAARQAGRGAGRQLAGLSPPARLAALCAAVLLSLYPCPATPASHANRCPISRSSARSRAPKPIRRERNGPGRGGGGRRRAAGRASSRSLPIPISSMARCAPRSRSSPRAHYLSVFLPPVRALEDYLELIAQIEAAAAALRVEGRASRGYAPPPDPRLKVLKATPDPGVIEVNIQPVSDWADTVDLTESLYDLARKQGLTADKFMVDGRARRHGRGQSYRAGRGEHQRFALHPPAGPPEELRHSTGSAIPRSPISSQGSSSAPTSQAPRIDEARHDGLYELEIALAQVPGSGTAEMPPPLAGRSPVPQPCSST